MMHRFLLHSLSHTVIVVDITDCGLPTDVFPPTGERRLVPSVRFQNWEDAKQYLGMLGADKELLEEAAIRLKQTSVAVLTIV